MRLHNAHGVQINVEDKLGEQLIGSGIYREGAAPAKVGKKVTAGGWDDDQDDDEPKPTAAQKRAAAKAEKEAAEAEAEAKTKAEAEAAQAAAQAAAAGTAG